MILFKNTNIPITPSVVNAFSPVINHPIRALPRSIISEVITYLHKIFFQLFLLLQLNSFENETHLVLPYSPHRNVIIKNVYLKYFFKLGFNSVLFM